MLQNLLVPIGIMVTLAVLGWLTQMLKNAQLRQEAERERQRRESMPVASPRRSNESSRGSESGPKPPISDIDRFLAEIDKLRQRGAGTEAPKAAPAPAPAKKPKPAAVPTVPVKKVRLSEEAQPAPFVATAAPPRPQPSRTPAPQKTDDLPIARTVSSTEKKAEAPLVAPIVTRYEAPRKTEPTTPFGQQLLGLLSSEKSLPLAVVLQEILGEPKCKKKG